MKSSNRYRSKKADESKTTLRESTEREKTISYKKRMGRKRGRGEHVATRVRFKRIQDWKVLGLDKEMKKVEAKKSRTCDHHFTELVQLRTKGAYEDEFETFEVENQL